MKRKSSKKSPSGTMLSIMHPKIEGEYQKWAAVVGVGPGGCAVTRGMATDHEWSLDSMEVKGITSKAAAIIGQRDGSSHQPLCQMLEDVDIFFLILDAKDYESMFLAAALAKVAQDRVILAFVRGSTIQASAGVKGLRDSVDALIVLPQEGLCTFSCQEAVGICILAILEVIRCGLLRIDAGHLTMLMQTAGGLGRVGIGRGRGHDAIATAAHAALNSLQEQLFLGSVAGGALLFQVWEGFSLVDINRATEKLRLALPPQALFISNFAVSRYLFEKEEGALSTFMVFGL
ncbi:MAG: hypothetical protein R6V13_08590 [Anaerolineae bacterium]